MDPLSSSSLFEQFLAERRYLKNVTPTTIEWHETAFKAFQRTADNRPLLIDKASLQHFVVVLTSLRLIFCGALWRTGASAERRHDFTLGRRLDSRPFSLGPPNRERPRHEAAARIQQVAAFEKLCFPPVRLAVKPQLAGHRRAVRRSDEFEQELTGPRLAWRWRRGVPEHRLRVHETTIAHRA
jgi:hypothetical protein